MYLCFSKNIPYSDMEDFKISSELKCDNFLFPGDNWNFLSKYDNIVFK